MDVQQYPMLQPARELQAITSGVATAAAPIEAPASVPALVAALYDEAPASLRERLLNHLLRAVGPLALAAVAAGAFARLLPAERWGSVQVHLDDVFFHIRPDHVADLASYVDQKAPEMLWGLPDVLSSSPLLMGTLTGALLLVALRQALRQRRRVQ